MNLLTPDHSVKAAGGEVLGFWPACGDHPSTPLSPHWALAPAPLPLVQLPTKIKAVTAKENAYLRAQRHLGSDTTSEWASAANNGTCRGVGSGTVLNSDTLRLS